MLKLHDFLHLPELDPLIQELVMDNPGLYVLAGIDARSVSGSRKADTFTPSGLSAIFNILLQEMLTAHPLAQAVVVSEDRGLARVPRKFSRRVRLLQVDPSTSYKEQIETAARQRPGLLVIDRLHPEDTPAVLRAAERGLRVMARLDTVLCGPAVARHFLDAGVPRDSLSALRWVISMQRMPVLCDRCKHPVEQSEQQIERVRQKYPNLDTALKEISRENQPVFYRAGSCDQCRQTGYLGDVAVFDLFQNQPDQADFFGQLSRLALEEYAMRLAARGQIDLDDLLNLEGEHLRRTYGMLTASERELTETNAALSRKVFELEASNRVLVQRTEVLIALQELNQALITSTELRDLAVRICRQAIALCGADRAVLYLRRAGDPVVGVEPLEARQPQSVAEILAVRGWDSALTGQKLPQSAVFSESPESSITRYMQVPPGMKPVPSSLAGETATTTIRMGVRVPLVTQERQVGVMIVQSTEREHFTPGEMSLLQTVANQAALAVQRAGLIEELRARILQLQAAQVELVKKERTDRELELAREVQQSMLPQTFPELSGFILSAKNEPARQVGGDFYDMIPLDDNHFGIVIADVADKGMPAALYMALTRSLIRAEAQRDLSPRRVLTNVNRLLLELGDLDGFVSVFYGVVEQPSRQMSYCRAGHEQPLLIRQSQVTALGGSGMVLGVAAGERDLALTEENINLLPGDSLVLFTDGLVDVADEEGRFLGHEKLECILQEHSSLDVADLCRAIFDDLARFRGRADPFDDMTLLILGVR